VTNRTRRLVGALIIGALVLLPLIGLAMERVVAVGPSSDEPLTLLLLGSDAGPPREDFTLNGRADGFQLVFVSADRLNATIVSIPRDSWVPVPGFGETKINACMTRGPENCVRTVEEAFDITVDAHFVTSMWGFADAVNEFSGCPSGPGECNRGITVDVDFTCTSQCGGLPIERTGVQQLNGYQALTYARVRKGREGGDFGRSQGQAELLALAHAEMRAEGSVARMMDALRILRRHSVTDLTMPQLVRLGLDAMRLDPANVERQLAPSVVATIGTASAVRLLPEAYPLISDAADNGVLDGSFTG
jgi:polyisoprenyl-teichoic acid--peptidoglycan teichoic acid transferase